MFLKPVWLYLPDGSKERIIAQTGGDKGISFDSIHSGVERKHYFKYSDYSITQTKKGDYVVSPVDDGYEKIYYPNGVYEYVSKVVQHNGFWEVHVRRYLSSEWRVECWSRRYASLEQKHDGWYWRRMRNVYWDTIDRQLTPEDRAREVRDRLTEFTSAISRDNLNSYISET